MSSRSPNQPTNRAPVSRDIVEIVKKKIGPPAGPPPSSATTFKAPKSYSNTRLVSRERDDYDDAEDEENSDDNENNDYNDEENGNQYQTEDRHRYRSNKKQEYNHHNSHHNRNNDNNYDVDNDIDNSNINDDLDPMSSYYNSAADPRTSYDNHGHGYSQSHDRRPSNSRGNTSSTRDDDYLEDGRDAYHSSSNSRRPSQSNQAPSYGSKPNSTVSSTRVETRASISKASPSRQSDDKRYARGPGPRSPSTLSDRSQSSPSKPYDSTSVRNGLFNFQPLLKATYRDLRNFSWTPCEEGILVRCYIERDRSGTNAFSPYYSLCADMDDGTGRELMVCRKVWKSRSPHYVFSLKPDDLYRKREQRSRLYLGKLRGISPSEYVLYDNGICRAPENTVDPDEQEEEVTEEEIEAREQYKRFSSEGSASNDEGSLYRKELAIISFNSKKRPPPPGIRGAEICLLPRNQGTGSGDEKSSSTTVGSKSTPLSYVQTFRKIRETGKQNTIHRSKMMIIHEKTSRYDPLSACLVDLKGRASIPSVKNCLFIMSEPMCEAGANPTEDDGKDFVLAMGKNADDCFNMDYRYPLSLLQAFAICVARFDANLSWQR